MAHQDGDFSPKRDAILRRLVKWYLNRSESFRQRTDRKLWKEACDIVSQIEAEERQKQLDITNYELEYVVGDEKPDWLLKLMENRVVLQMKSGGFLVPSTDGKVVVVPGDKITMNALGQLLVTKTKGKNDG